MSSEKNLGQLLKEAQECNNGFISHKEMVVRAEKQLTEDLKALAIQYFFDVCRLKILHQIKVGERVEVTSRDLNKIPNVYTYYSRKSEFEVVLHKNGKHFLNWLKENGLTYILHEDHDGVGMESWVTMKIKPITKSEE